MKGKVKWFDIRKGYGFIQGEDGQDYFVHAKALPEGTQLHENEEVSFDPAETDRGKQAQNVSVGGESQPSDQEEEPQAEESQDQAEEQSAEEPEEQPQE